MINIAVTTALLTFIIFGLARVISAKTSRYWLLVLVVLLYGVMQHINGYNYALSFTYHGNVYL